MISGKSADFHLSPRKRWMKSKTAKYTHHTKSNFLTSEPNMMTDLIHQRIWISLTVTLTTSERWQELPGRCSKASA